MPQPPCVPAPDNAPVESRPLVSVIVPTIRRPALLQRALASVFAQSYAPLEIIVAVDGPDPATEAVLREIDDSRLRVLLNPSPLGAGAARNAAAALARGAWLAFLDDDDEWLPTKLERQLAGHSPEEDVLLACQCHVRMAGGVQLWPRRAPYPRERLDEYLFGRRSFARGEAYLATPALVMPTRLFHAAGGFGHTPQNEDRTLQLRATRLGARLEMRLEPLVIVHAEDAARSTGTQFPWREQLGWLQDQGDMMGPRAYSGFCLVVLGSQAARLRDFAAIPVLLRLAWRRGRPSAVQLAVFASFWLAPTRLRHAMRQISNRGEPIRC